MENPVEMGNLQRQPKPWVGGVFREVTGEVCVAQPGNQRKPGNGLEFVVGENGFEAPGGAFEVLKVGVTAIVEQQAELLAIALAKDIETGLRVVVREM